MPRLLLCCSGSVATIKLPDLLAAFTAMAGWELKVVLTQRARHFLPADLEAEILTDEDEWKLWAGRGDPVLHIQLAQWADLCLVAPLSANTLAKLAHGLADNLLTSTLRAWDLTKPVLIAPAMNTFMWDHPATSQQLDILSWRGAVRD